MLVKNNIETLLKNGKKYELSETRICAKTQELIQTPK